MHFNKLFAFFKLYWLKASRAYVMAWFPSSVSRSVCPSVRSSFSCLRDKVYTFGRIFVKLSQFVHVINSLNHIDFQNNLTISLGKVVILSWKFAILVYAIKSIFLVGFSWNFHSSSISSIALTLLIFGQSVWESSHFNFNLICNFCLRDKENIFGRILVKLTQVVHLINSFNPIDFQKRKKIGQSVWESSHFKLNICNSCLRDKVHIFWSDFRETYTVCTSYQ